MGIACVLEETLQVVVAETGPVGFGVVGGKVGVGEGHMGVSQIVGGGGSGLLQCQ